MRCASNRLSTTAFVEARLAHAITAGAWHERAFAPLAIGTPKDVPADLDHLGTDVAAHVVDQLAQRAAFNLPHPLSSDTHGAPDLLEGHALGMQAHGGDCIGVLVPLEVGPRIARRRGCRDGHRIEAFGEEIGAKPHTPRIVVERDREPAQQKANACGIESDRADTRWSTGTCPGNERRV